MKKGKGALLSLQCPGQRNHRDLRPQIHTGVERRIKGQEFLIRRQADV